jgi:hypothetical protein
VAHRNQPPVRQAASRTFFAGHRPDLSARRHWRTFGRGTDVHGDAQTIALMPQSRPQVLTGQFEAVAHYGRWQVLSYLDWRRIEEAPFEEDVELYRFGFYYRLGHWCRRTAEGWVRAATGAPLDVTPVMWKPLVGERFPRKVGSCVAVADGVLEAVGPNARDAWPERPSDAGSRELHCLQGVRGLGASGEATCAIRRKTR